MTQKQDREVVFRVFGDVASVEDFDLNHLGIPRNELGDAAFDESSLYEWTDCPKRPFLMIKNVHVYDVYQDGTFHFFDPRFDKPAHEPKEYVEDRKEVEDYIEEHNIIGWGGITGGNRASQDENEYAFQTLCKLGFGPQNRGFSDDCLWYVPRHEGTLRNTVRNYRVEYLGEDEPWIDENEYCERHGLPPVVD